MEHNSIKAKAMRIRLNTARSPGCEKGTPLALVGKLAVSRCIGLGSDCSPHDRSGSISTEMGFPSDVRFTPDSDRTADIAVGPVSANGRLASLAEFALLISSSRLKCAGAPVGPTGGLPREKSGTLPGAQRVSARSQILAATYATSGMRFQTPSSDQEGRLEVRPAAIAVTNADIQQRVNEPAAGISI